MLEFIKFAQISDLTLSAYTEIHSVDFAERARALVYESQFSSGNGLILFRPFKKIATNVDNADRCYQRIAYGYVGY